MSMPKHLHELLVCAVCKRQLIVHVEQLVEEEVQEGTLTCSACGRRYPVRQGIPNLIPDLDSPYQDLESSALRRTLQQYENWLSEYTTEDARSDMELADDIHPRIRLVGSVLDVGGAEGLIRKYLESHQQYLCVDPLAIKPSRLKFLAPIWPDVVRPYSFVQGVADYLPIKSRAFESIVMRSVIDHTFNPNLALREAWRVLAPEGRLVVGLTVEDRAERSSLLQRAIRSVRRHGLTGSATRMPRLLSDLLFPQSRQLSVGHFHTFTYDGMLRLLAFSDFVVEDEITSPLNTGVVFFVATKAVPPGSTY